MAHTQGTPEAAPPPDAAAIAGAVAALARGGLVAFPTETVYGLGADAEQPAAVAAIFRAKGRPPTHPLIVHLAEPAAARAWAVAVPEAARALMARFWPGPLTLILPRSARAGDAVTGGQDTVGLRCPAHPWAQALLRAYAQARGDACVGLAAPSANRYGRISPTSAAHVLADLGLKPQGAVDVVLDGGRCTLGIESTIVDFATGRARILRPGSIRAEQIRAVAGALAGAEEAAPAPRVSGRLAAHYAPRKPLHLVAPAELAQRIAAAGAARSGVLAPPELPLGVAAAALALWCPAASDPEAYAHALYEDLHRLDDSAAQVLLVAQPPCGEAWDAVRDRLQRAAAGSAGGLDEAD